MIFQFFRFSDFPVFLIVLLFRFSLLWSCVVLGVPVLPRFPVFPCSCFPVFVSRVRRPPRWHPRSRPVWGGHQATPRKQPISPKIYPRHPMRGYPQRPVLFKKLEHFIHFRPLIILNERNTNAVQPAQRAAACKL